MDSLTNIWMAFSTPNEYLINILSFPLLLIESYLSILLFPSILNIEITNKKKIFYVIFATLIGFLSENLIPIPYNIFVNYFFISILIYKLFKLSLIKSISCAILPSILFSLIGMLTSNSFVILFNISSEDLSVIPIYRISYALITYIFIGIIIFIIKICNLNINFLDDLDKKNRLIIFANLVLGFIAIIVQSIIIYYYIDILPMIFTFLSFLILLIYFSISLYSLTRVIKLSLTTRKLQSAEEYNNTLHILHDNVRGFKHDFDNIVTTIGGYIKTEDMKGLKNYYLQLSDDCQKVNNLYILNPDIINNDGIYNLLTKKYHEADSKDIKVNITFLLDLSTLKMKIYEFARILGILLDNAIEASSACDEKIINLIFRDDSKHSRQLIIIENTYNNKEINIDKIFEKGITEKDNHTGLGLWEVRKILNKNNNVNLFTSKNDKFFSQQLEIYY